MKTLSRRQLISPLVASKQREPMEVLARDVALPVVTLERNVLFPQNTLPVGALARFTKRERRDAESGLLKVVALPFEDSDAGRTFAPVGTLAVVTGLLHLPSGETGMTLHGTERVLVREVKETGGRLRARVDIVRPQPGRETARSQALLRGLRNAIHRLLRGQLEVSPESRALLLSSHDLGELSDLMAPYLSWPFADKLSALTTLSPAARARLVLAAVRRELEFQKLSERIHKQVQGDLREEERRSYLREQILALKRELGELDDPSAAGEQLEEALAAIKLPPLAEEAMREELERLNMSAPGSPEYMVAHAYLSLIRDLPWEEKAPKAPDLAAARRTLAREHHGLEDAKQRVLEYLAVLRHRGEAPGQILLLVGPPGVGKTSLVRSIATATGRPFARLALGGVKDEAEIRGHRRTYIGSLPGKIIQAIKQTKSRYPVILLDEIDKVGGDKQAGIAASLLEVLDREQNAGFIDHYLAIPFDVSQALFIATANNLDAIPEPLRDRLEIVEVPSYTDQEKLKIARKHIIPGLRKELKLTAEQFSLSDATIMAILRRYTREAGVRQLKRELTRLARKIVLNLVESKSRRRPMTVRPDNLEQWLGVTRFIDEPNDQALPPGVAVGLAYTSVGGEILYVETSVRSDRHGKGTLKLTGNIGKVMQESAQAVLSFLSRHAEALGVRPEVFTEGDVHVHLPDGGTPKDGPSAGIAILCALASAALRKPLSARMAMTGEITLRGQVLAVGGIREKVLAAHRYGKNTVLYPAANASDLKEIPEEVRREMRLIPVTTMGEVLELAGLCPRLALELMTEIPLPHIGLSQSLPL